MLKQICDVLTALRQYLHQAHLCAQDKGYAAHLLLNDLYERYLAKQFVKKNKWNVPVFCDIACAIGRRDIEICLHDGHGTIYKRYTERKSPQTLIKQFKLGTPIYAHLCSEGLFSGI